MKSFSPKRWFRAYFTWALIEFLETNQRVLPDYSGLNSLFIDPTGSIYPSDVWGLEIGYLQRMSKANDWNEFSQRTRDIIISNQSPANWMICTARQAMKKHWFVVFQWILRKKFYFPIKNKHSKKKLSLFLKRISSLF